MFIKQAQKKIRKFYVVLAALFLTMFSYGQVRDIEISGSVIENRDKLEGATVEIYTNNALVNKIVIDKTGKYEFSLNYDKIYTVVYSKPGYVSKRLSFNTTGIPPEAQEFGFEYDDVEVSLFKKIEGLDVSILEQPVGKIFYDPEYGTLEYDAEYTKTIKSKLEKLFKDLEEKQAEEEERLKQIESDYKSAIASADKYYKNKEYELAQLDYEKATSLKPAEDYPRQKIAELASMLANLEEQNRQFEALTGTASKLESEKKYKEAIAKYEQAKLIKPNSDLPQQRIDAINQLLQELQQAEANKEQEKQAAYDKAMQEGDQLVASKKFDEGIAAYQKALVVFTNDALAQEKISVAKELKEQLQSQLDAQKAKEQEAYNAFNANEWQKALDLYTELEAVNSTKEYQEKIKQAKAKLQEEKNNALAQQKLNEEYKAAISKGNDLLALKNYKSSRIEFEKAKQLKPSEALPQEKLSEIERLISEAQAAQLAAEKDKEFNSLIAAAEVQVKTNAFDEAILTYRKALAIKPQNNFVKDKILVAEDLKALFLKEKEAAKVNQQVAELLAQGNKQKQAKEYTKALDTYKQALALQPANNQVQTRIQEVEQFLSDLASKQEKEAQQEQFNQLIASANKELKANNFSKAKEVVDSALALNISNAIANKKLEEINTLESAYLKQQEQAELTQQFNEFVQQGDNAFKNNEYEGAINAYEQALALKPNAPTIQEKINEVKEAQKLANEKELQAQKQTEYNSTVEKANKALGLKNYSEAIQLFEKASTILPFEQLPKDKIKEINGIIAQLDREKQLKNQFEGLVREGDNLFNTMQYTAAIEKFEAAIKLFDSKEVKEKIKLAQNAQAEQNELRKSKAQYESLIAKGDAALNQKNLDAAEDAYTKAKVINNTEYVANQLAKVASARAELSAQLRDQELKLAYEQQIKEADRLFAELNYDEAFKAYEKAKAILETEAYPTTKIQEIQEIQAAQAKAKLEAEKLEQAYKELITAADKALESKELESAKNNYNKALELKPNESYPRNKLVEIQKLELEIQYAEELKQQAAEKLKEYNAAMAKGVELLNQEKYNEAKAEYNKASLLFSDKPEPKEKIDEINALQAKLAEEKAKQQQLEQAQKRYEFIIGQAAEQLALKNYDKAKELYNSALQLFDQQEPKTKIAEIEKIQADLEKQRELERLQAEELKKKKTQYESLIRNADNAFGLKQYGNATNYYNQAQALFPTENYPKQMLQKIEDLEKLANQNNQQHAEKNDNETSEAYLSELAKQYPQGVTEEIITVKNRKITRRIVVNGTRADEYKYILYNWGGRYYFKNDKPISEFMFNKETTPAK